LGKSDAGQYQTCPAEYQAAHHFRGGAEIAGNASLEPGRDRDTTSMWLSRSWTYPVAGFFAFLARALRMAIARLIALLFALEESWAV